MTAGRALEQTRRALAACDEIIVDIERVPGREMPARVRASYDDALEARSGALDRLRRPLPSGTVVTRATEAQEICSLALGAVVRLIDVEHALFPERRWRTLPAL